jgi:hypothetical protein
MHTPPSSSKCERENHARFLKGAGPAELHRGARRCSRWAGRPVLLRGRTAWLQTVREEEYFFTDENGRLRDARDNEARAIVLRMHSATDCDRRNVCSRRAQSGDRIGARGSDFVRLPSFIDPLSTRRPPH